MTELELLLKLALNHNSCSSEQARIEGDTVLIPFDVHRPGREPEWTIEYERVRTRGEFLEAFGYG